MYRSQIHVQLKSKTPQAGTRKALGLESDRIDTSAKLRCNATIKSKENPKCDEKLLEAKGKQMPWRLIF